MKPDFLSMLSTRFGHLLVFMESDIGMEHRGPPKGLWGHPHGLGEDVKSISFIF